MSEALSDAHDHPGAAEPEAPDRPRFDPRARVTETLVLVASVVVLRLVGVLLLVASSYELGSIDALLTLVVMIVDPNLLVWIALAAVVQFGLRPMRRPGRWALILVAAPVAVLLVSIARGLAYLGSVGFVALLGNSAAWLDAGILAVVVALGLVFTVAFLSRERRTSARIAGGLLALGGLLTLVLLWQAFEVYFTLFGSEPEVTQADGDRYLITAAVTLGALVGAIVFASISRRPALIITACIVGCLGLVVAIAVPVPADRFTPPEPTAVPAGPGGGGSCYGPGDPNCIGG